MKHLILVLIVDIQPGDSCAKTRPPTTAVVRHEDPEEGWSAQKESGDNILKLYVNSLLLGAKIVNFFCH